MKVSGDNGVTEFAYDKFGRPEIEKNERGSIISKYNAKGLLEEKICTLNASSEKYSTKYFYDEYERLARVVSGAGEYVYSYDGNNRISSLKGPAYTENRVYDKAGRLLSKTVNGKTACSYEYDKMDRRVKAEVNGVKWDYKYDEFGQLLSAKPSDGKAYNYNYDKIGNSLAFAGKSNKFNQLNQLVNPGIKYDDYGNMTATADGWKYGWDMQNRLIKAEKGDTKLEFAYDFMSRRIGKKVYESGKLTSDEKFLFDGFNMTLKHDGKAVQHFAWNGQDLLSMTDGDKSYSYIKDGNKNVIELLSKDGKISAKYAYSPFGETISTLDKNDNNPYRFSSEQWDETLGLAYYNYRYYSPGMGRWLSRDPIAENGGRNIYAFVKNGAIDKWDYWGLYDYILGRTTPPETVLLDISGWNTDHSLSTYELSAILYRVGANIDGGKILYPDAAMILAHYIANTGTTYTVDYEKMLRDCAMARGYLRLELGNAMRSAETIANDVNALTYQFSMVRASENAQATELQNDNWLYAIGKYRIWGSADVDSRNNAKCFSMTWTLNLRDVYDWSLTNGKKGGYVYDHEMALLYYNGWAKPFKVEGQITIEVKWTKGQIPNMDQVEKAISSKTINLR